MWTWRSNRCSGRLGSEYPASRCWKSLLTGRSLRRGDDDDDDDDLVEVMPPSRSRPAAPPPAALSASSSLLAGAGVLEEEDLEPRWRDWLDQQGLLEDWDAEYGLLAPEDSIIIRPYGGEDDDILLQELRPRFVVMYEPNLAFIRRLEVGCTQRPANRCRCTRTAILAWLCAYTR